MLSFGLMRPIKMTVTVFDHVCATYQPAFSLSNIGITELSGSWTHSLSLCNSPKAFYLFVYLLTYSYLFVYLFIFNESTRKMIHYHLCPLARFTWKNQCFTFQQMIYFTAPLTTAQLSHWKQPSNTLIYFVSYCQSCLRKILFEFQLTNPVITNSYIP